MGKATLRNSRASFKPLSNREAVPGSGADSRVLDSPSAPVALDLVCLGLWGVRVGGGWVPMSSYLPRKRPL